MKKVVFALHVTLALVIASSLSAKTRPAPAVGVWPPQIKIPEATQFLSPRVLGGRPSFNELVVGMYFKNEDGNGSICSGLYISGKHVLTAKHCTCHQNGFFVTNSQDILSEKATWVDATLQDQFGKKCSRLASFDMSEGNDLAILALEHPLALSDGSAACGDFNLTPTIRLLGTWLPTPPIELTVVGYGTDLIDPGSQEQRRQANPRIGTLTCATQTWRTLGCVPYRELVAGLHAPGKPSFDACGGDSGGPAFALYGGILAPFATVSRALPIPQPMGKCGSGGIYTDLGRADVIAWLKKNLNEPTDLCTIPTK